MPLPRRDGDVGLHKLTLGKRTDRELNRTGLLVDEKERGGLGENDPPGYVKDRPEQLIVVGD